MLGAARREFKGGGNDGRVDRAVVRHRSIVRTNGLPASEENAVELEAEEVRVGVPAARRRHGGGQRHRRVELGHEAPRGLAVCCGDRGGSGPEASRSGRGGGAEEEKDARARAVIAIGVAGRQRSAMPTAKCVSASRGETFLVGGLERPGPARLCHGGPGRKQIRSTGLSGPFPFSPSLSGL
jgi:hypothetical protein